jgi:hypothetical protein
MGRVAHKEADRIDIAKHAAVSQLNYLRLAVLGGRKRKDS